MKPTPAELRTAYRECARALIAYKEGFTLDPHSGYLGFYGTPGAVHFGEPGERLHGAILVYTHQPERFQKLSAADRKELPEFMLALQKVASARASGERFLFAELTEKGTPLGPVQENPLHDGVDHALLTEMKKIWKRLRAETPEKDRSPVDTDAMVDSEAEAGSAYLLYNEGFRSALQSLVQALLDAKSNQMKKEEVERALEDCGYFDFLEAQTSRAETLRKKLGLAAHPEGGHYSEVHRSAAQVQHGGKSRAALTSIYFLLSEGQVSRWHQVDADEAWHYYEGRPLELYVMPPDFSRVEKIRLGTLHRNGTKPVHVVPAGWWQAARTSSEYTLCGCTVAPGFEFSGFRLLKDAEKATVKKKFPELGFLV